MTVRDGFRIRHLTVLGVHTDGCPVRIGTRASRNGSRTIAVPRLLGADEIAVHRQRVCLQCYLGMFQVGNI